MLSEAAKTRIQELFPRYPDKRSCTLAALRIAQKEQGYISEEAMADIGVLLELTPVQVYETATFYTMFTLQPVGKYLIQVCRTLSCALVGAGSLIRHLEQKLGITAGETTPDGLFTLKKVECLAGCGAGPMMQINDEYYEYLTTDKVDRILEDLRRDGKSSLASGPFLIPLQMA
ncbi:MAG: NADH-quinone oxidoreductase subunit NuoE [Nitrospirota bacterium]